MSESGRETLPDVQETPRMSWSGQKVLPGVQEWSGDPSKCLGVVGRLFWRSRSSREALLNVRKRSGDPPGHSRQYPGYLIVVGDAPECPGGPPECLGVIGRPSWMSKSGREALPDVREWLGNLFQKYSAWPSGCPGTVGDPPGCPGVVGRPSQILVVGMLS